MDATLQIVLKIKDQEFVLSIDEASELYSILGKVVGKKEPNFDLIRNKLEEIKAKQSVSPFVPIPQPYPVPVYPRRYWDIIYTQGRSEVLVQIKDGK